MPTRRPRGPGWRSAGRAGCRSAATPRRPTGPSRARPTAVFSSAPPISTSRLRACSSRRKLRRGQPDHRLAEGDDVHSAVGSVVGTPHCCRPGSAGRSRRTAPPGRGAGRNRGPPPPSGPRAGRRRPGSTPRPCRNSAAVVRSTPPVGIRRTCGSGPRIALKNAGPTTSAGNTFTMSAPASQAARISVGVNAPGMTSLSYRRHRRITSRFTVGETMNSAPASRAARHVSGSSTVPAPSRTGRPAPPSPPGSRRGRSGRSW